MSMNFISVGLFKLEILGQTDEWIFMIFFRIGLVFVICYHIIFRIMSMKIIHTYSIITFHVNCVGKLTIIGSDNGLSPGRRQAIICTDAGILLIRTLETHFSEN